MTGDQAWIVGPDRRLGPDPLLATAVDAVRRALPGPPDHEAARARILAFCDAHPDALERSCRDGHLTGSALVVEPEARRALLLHHAKVRRWLQPGGHADGDANMAGVARREAFEETGIATLAVALPAVDLDVHRFHAASGAELDHWHLDVRHLVAVPPGVTVTTNRESLGHRWVDLDRLAAGEEDLDGAPVEAGIARLARAGSALLDQLGSPWQ